MRHNREFMDKLATWRELDQAEQAALLEHAAHCPSCSERLALYEKQDRLLSAMPVLPSRFTYADVQARIASRRAPFTLRRAWAVAAVFLLFLGLSAGTVAASGDSLPGDLLYPLKLQVESARLWGAADDVMRDELSARFAERRRNEARALLLQGRLAEMNIEGYLSDVQSEHWTVSGLTIAVPRELWQGEPPAAGQRIEMRIEIGAQEMRALAIRWAQQGEPGGGPGQVDTGPGAVPTEPDRSATPAAPTLRGATPMTGPAGTTQPMTRTAAPEPTSSNVQVATATHATGIPTGSVPRQATAIPATETAGSGHQPGPTGSPEPGPTGPTRTPNGSQSGQPGGGGH